MPPSVRQPVALEIGCNNFNVQALVLRIIMALPQSFPGDTTNA